MSDSETSDSDSGIRFKTTSTRYKEEKSSKYSPSNRSSRRSEDSSHRSRSNRDRDRDRDRGGRDRGRDRRRTSRSKSRSRSRERHRRREKERKRHHSRSRSRSRSKSTRSSHDRKERETNPVTRSSIEAEPSVQARQRESNEPTKIEEGKILDISVSSLSSQEDHIGKDETLEENFGPALPPSLSASVTEDGNHIEENDALGPALPPHLLKKNEDINVEEKRMIIGPALPIDFKPTQTTGESSESELSPFSEEEPAGDDHEDDEFIGPVPGASSSRAAIELEKRALEMKMQRFEGSYTGAKSTNVTSREDWMLELPDIRKVSDMGLGARQFRTREKQEIGDRSVWTDTPSDKERKKNRRSSKDAAHERELEQERRLAADRDKQQEEMVKRHKKKHKRDKSLLEIHQKKVEKEKREDKSSEPTRRPFDRNVDLHANRFDEAQKKSIYKKAQLLDTRFSSGASKFL